jgi:tetratricopeptide (TPR) repeat protein
MNNYSNFDSDELLALADLNFRNEDYEATMHKVKVLLARSEKPLQTYALMGRVYAIIGLLEKAKGAFEYYLKHQNVQEHTLNEHFQLGMVEKDLGNIDTAIDSWDALLQNTPNFAPALYHKALALKNSGRVKDAIEPLNHILETAEDGDSYIEAADKLLSSIALQ